MQAVGLPDFRQVTSISGPVCRNPDERFGLFHPIFRAHRSGLRLARWV